MRNFIKRLFCFHPRLQCEEYNPYGLEAEFRITYSSPWALFATKETKYKCNKCGGFFYYPSGNFQEELLREKIIKILCNNN